MFIFFNCPIIYIACTAERFFRIDKAQEHLHYVSDICNDELYILDPADDNSGTTAPTSSSALNNYNINYTMVTSSASGTGLSGLSQQTSSLSSGEGNTIVLFKPDDQQLSSTNQQQQLQQQESIDRSINQQQQPQAQHSKLNTSLSSLSTVHTMSPIESSPPYHQTPQQQSSIDLKDDLDQINAKVNSQFLLQQQQQPQQSQITQRQHHNVQLNAAILANRNIEILNSQNEHVLFKAASTGILAKKNIINF